MSKLFQYNVRCILIIFLIISISYAPVYGSPAIQLEKEVVIDSPMVGVANLPDQMTFRLYDSGTAAAPIASQSFYRGGYSAYYNIAKSDGLTQKSLVRLSVEFTDLSQLGSNVDALSNLWLEVEIDGRPLGEREPLNKEAAKQILSLATAQNTIRPDTPQNVTKQVSGSDGQVQYNNGGVEGGAGQFYYDDVNHRVGIGTAGPGGKLGIAAAINTYPLRTSGGNLETFLYQGGSSGIWFTNSSGWFNINNQIGDLSFNASNMEVIRLKNGNVGIGTSTPDGKLGIAAASNKNKRW